MSRVVVTADVVVAGVKIPKGAVIEATAAQLAAITGAGGVTRATGTTTAHDTLGEAVGVSNGS
jgi:hypothetical protein